MAKFRFTYPVDLSTDETGRVVAEIPDLGGCVTDGSDRAEALNEAADALSEAIAGIIRRRELIPAPSSANGRPVVSPDVLIAAKAALYLAMRETKTSNVSLAAKLGCAETEVRRMLDPRHATKIGRLEEALAIFGHRVVITVEAA